MASTTLAYRSHSTDRLSSNQSSFHSLRTVRSACAIDDRSHPVLLSSTSTSSYSLDNQNKTENLICSTLTTRQKPSDYFHKSNSLDSGYKTLSAASHGTSHTDPIDEENEHQHSFLQMASSPSSCSSSSFAVSNTTTNQKLNSKIEFVVDDEDDVDDKQLRLSRKNSKSNIEGREILSRSINKSFILINRW